MTYFSQFPLTTYTTNNDVSVVKDIFRRVAFLSEYKPFTDMYISHTIVDGETPESLAKNYYGSTSFHWVVLIFNELHNPSFDWPLTNSKLEKVCVDVYGDAAFMVKHYERAGIVVGEVKEFVGNVIWVPPENPYPIDPNTHGVIFFNFLEVENDKKRNIQLLRPELLGNFVQQFQDAING